MKYGWRQAEVLVKREIELQAKYSKKHQGLHIPALFGPPGIGKTDLMLTMATHTSLPLLVINFGELADPADVGGAPFPSQGKDGHRFLETLLPDLLEQACSSPRFLLIDDIDKAPPRYQGVLLGMAGTRSIRNRPFHPATLLAVAGNNLGEDSIGNEISNSLRGRITSIETEATLADFAVYAKESGNIHPSILGFLHYKPEYLHKAEVGDFRYPSPRSWREVSLGFEEEPNPHRNLFADIEDAPRLDAWEGIVKLKCGQSVGNDFGAWYKVIRGIDIQKILTEGTFEYKEDEPGRVYAVIYAAANTINNDPKKSWAGLSGFVNHLHNEKRVALLSQLTTKAREVILKKNPNVMDALLAPVVRTGGV
jgi:hypothetical protein